ncbi:Gfo/Idh/MocA family protein [Pseudothermotoga sp. U03pept]|uniref:Gfo/Idh/MocA family protein n=1 Tax=Pseudothermotoga sp. U03pept TaxID=3447012 RepID=UPI003F00D773
MQKIRVGMVGVGFIAKIHMAAFAETSQFIEVVGVCASKRENAENFASQYKVPLVFENFEQLCASEEIDVVDICAPTALHDAVIFSACENKKHVICEKPLIGYYGEDEPGIEHVGFEVSKTKMYQEISRKMTLIEQKITQAGVKFMYAENWVYAPSVEKMKRLLRVSDGVVFELRAECSHSGSQASYSRKWRTSGGGSLMRLGSHPIAAVLHMKYFEGLVRSGRPIKPVAVVGEIGYLTKMESLKDRPCYVARGWEDVEDWSMAIIDFDDGSKATVFSTDLSLGGVKNKITAYMSNGVITANMTPNDSVVAFAPNETVWKDEYICEKLETKAGYSFPSADEFWARGYPQEMKDFALSVLENREPASGFDLAKQTVQVIYAAYLSAELQRKVKID